jgi:hypothetical protein
MGAVTGENTVIYDVDYQYCGIGFGNWNGSGDGGGEDYGRKGDGFGGGHFFGWEKVEKLVGAVEMIVEKSIWEVEHVL